MFRYIIKRILISIPLLLGISLFTFALIQLTPGNFFDTLKLDPQISSETIAHYEQLYNLDKPLLQQYGYWLKNVLQLNFGYSFYYNCPVSTIIKSRLLNTFILSLSGMLLTWMVAIPLGIVMAVHRNRFWDRFLSFGAFIFLSIPGFFLAILLLYFAAHYGGLPSYHPRCHSRR